MDCVSPFGFFELLIQKNEKHTYFTKVKTHLLFIKLFFSKKKSHRILEWPTFLQRPAFWNDQPFEIDQPFSYKYKCFNTGYLMRIFNTFAPRCELFGYFNFHVTSKEKKRSFQTDFKLCKILPSKLGGFFCLLVY